MRYLSIDLGDKRTGVALGDDETRIVAPLEVVEVPIDRHAGGALIGALSRIFDDQIGTDPGEIVLGLPLNMDGTEGPRAKASRAFGVRLEEAIGRRVHLHDERLTSAGADEHFAERARSGARLTNARKKARRDALAAALLLESFLAGV